jgi:hypothetical protein
MESNGRTFQQNLVWTRLSDGLKTVEAANDNLESRAAKIVLGSSGAISAITAVGLFPKSIVSLDRLESIVLCCLCSSVLVMFWFAARLWAPRPTSVQTTSDVSVLYDEYIAKTEDVAFNNALIDMAQSFEHAAWVNKTKGNELRNMFFVLQSQIVLLGVGVLIKAFL